MTGDDAHTTVLACRQTQWNRQVGWRAATAATRPVSTGKLDTCCPFAKEAVRGVRWCYS